MGKRPTPGRGHDLSAFACKARLSLRLQSGDRVTLDGEERILGEDGFARTIAPGQTVRFDGWSLTSEHAPWTFRWPVRTNNPYAHLEPDEELAIAEAALYNAATNTVAYPFHSLYACGFHACSALCGQWKIPPQTRKRL